MPSLWSGLYTWSLFAVFIARSWKTAVMTSLRYELLFLALCRAGEYYSVTFAECRVCPANTVNELSECPCAVGYYRASGEEDIPCTRELDHV
jgi:hypothetical protein